MIRCEYFPHPLVTLNPRDLLLQEAMPIGPTDVALEVGTGGGSSLLRLAGLPAVLHGVDVCEGPVERLRAALARRGGAAAAVELFVLDFCQPGAFRKLPARYDLIFSCDTVEHVPDAALFFANIHSALKPGGRIFVTFPNESPGRAHGITHFATRAELERLLVGAGFAAQDLRIETIRLNRSSGRVMGAAWSLPRRLAKKAVKAARGGGERPPQTFDETDFHAAAGRLEPLAPVINAYCCAVLNLMGLAPPRLPHRPGASRRRSTIRISSYGPGSRAQGKMRAPLE